MYARFLSTMALAAVLAGTPSHAVDLPLAAAAWQAKVHPRVFVDTATGQRASVVVLLADQADLSTAQLMRDADARGRHVYRALTAHAARSQAPLRRWLEARGIRYRAFWAANLLVIDGDRDLIEQLARRSDTRAIESNAPVRWVDEPPTGMEALATGTAGIEWGVGSVNAPAVWAMGYTGQGIVVAGQDSGVQWDHPALRPHYRGWNGSTADHNYNWHDAIHDAVDNPCGNDAPAPCDDLGHGTHTIGTIAGDDGNGNQIGVAPGARWIGCRNMDSNFGTPERYTECFQFFIAPTDQNGGNPDPTRRPHVINNSWVCPPQEGCAADTLAAIVHNTEAAGILVVASAGNAGPDCSTISDPPALYSDAFSVGAYDSTNTLAGFSSRGPVTADGSNRPKPDIVAPGVNVRSAYPPDTYNGMQGTSMAGPHVVGVVALLWSAQPRLARDIAATKALLERTAHPDVTVSPAQTCGGISTDSTPNNAVGYGRIDALAAVNAALLPTPTPSPTDTPDPTVTGTPTVTPSATATNTATQTPVPSPTSTETPSPTPTNTPTPTGSATATPTSTATTTPTVTRTPTPTTTPSPTATRTQTATNTPSGTPTATPTFTPSPTPTATATQSATGTATNTTTPTSSPTATSTPTPTSTVTRTATSTPSSSPTGTHAPTPTRTPTASPTSVPSATVTPTYTGTSTPTASPSPVPTQTSTVTPTSTATATRTPTATLTATAVATATPTPTPSSTPTVPPSPTTTATHTATLTATATATPSATAPPSATPTPTPTRTPTSEATATPSPTATVAPSPTPTAFPSATQTVTRTATRTPSATPTPVPTKSPTSTPTASDTPTPTVTKMPTASVTSTPTPTATGSPTTAVKPDCVGQCTARAPVTVSDIVTMVNIALGNASIVTCPAGDADSNGQIAIDEILLATYNALHGCPTTGLAVAGPM